MSILQIVYWYFGIAFFFSVVSSFTISQNYKDNEGAGLLLASFSSLFWPLFMIIIILSMPTGIMFSIRKNK